MEAFMHRDNHKKTKDILEEMYDLESDGAIEGPSSSRSRVARHEKKGKKRKKGTSRQRNEKKKNSKRRRKRGGFRIWKLFLFLIFLSVGLFFFAKSSFFNVEEIRVVNNKHFTDEQIMQLSKLPYGKNIFKMKLGEYEDKLRRDPYIKEVNIKRSFPKTLVIEVKERKELAAVAFSGQYAIIDEDLVVIKVSEINDGYILINGIEMDAYTAGEKIKTPQLEALKSCIEVVNVAVKKDLYFKEIEYKDGKMDIRVYDTLMIVGEKKPILESMDKIKNILSDLYDKNIVRGKIIIAEDGYASFSPEYE